MCVAGQQVKDDEFGQEKHRVARHEDHLGMDAHG
jgi:hypothetical protein